MKGAEVRLGLLAKCSPLIMGDEDANGSGAIDLPATSPFTCHLPIFTVKYTYVPR